MFLDNYYDDIMKTDVTDFSNCANKIALYNKRVQDIKENFRRVNSLVAHHKEERKKMEDVIAGWNLKKEQYLEISKKAAAAGNMAVELKAKGTYADINGRMWILDDELDYHDTMLNLLEKAHTKLIKDAEALKAIEATIANEYTGEPKTVGTQTDTENADYTNTEKKEPIFSVYTDVFID